MNIKQLILRWKSRGCFVIADPKDSSITLSKRLFSVIKRGGEKDSEAKVFVFRIKDKTNRYAFVINPKFKEKTYLSDIQYNEKYKCVGFETQYPTVGGIFYEYGLPANMKVKLSVSIDKTSEYTYYIIEKPNAKLIGKHKKA